MMDLRLATGLFRQVFLVGVISANTKAGGSRLE